MASASATLLKSSPIIDKSEWIKGQNLRHPSVCFVQCNPTSAAFTVRASSYADELVKTAKTVASPGRGILAMDESNATCGKRLASIGLENTEANRQAYRTLLVSAPGLGNYISGAILFEETLYQSTIDGKKMVDVLVEQNIVPGIKVDKGLVPLPGSNNESWCQGLDGLSSRTAAYYQQGARFAKWRTVVSIPNGPSALAVKEAAWGLARYAAISQDSGLVPIVEPEILLDGDHGIDRTFEVAQKVWAEVFFYLAENNVMFEGILLKPSMVTPGAECKDKATPQQVADYTLKLLHRRIPPAVPGIMFLSGGQSEVEATLNLNAMNQSPNPWHVSFSYARALQNTCLKTWGGRPENVKAAQDALLVRAKANSLAQLGKYTGEGESEEAKKGIPWRLVFVLDCNVLLVNKLLADEINQLISYLSITLSIIIKQLNTRDSMVLPVLSGCKLRPLIQILSYFIRTKSLKPRFPPNDQAYPLETTSKGKNFRYSALTRETRVQVPATEALQLATNANRSPVSMNLSHTSYHMLLAPFSKVLMKEKSQGAAFCQPSDPSQSPKKMASASATLLKSSPIIDKSEWIKGQNLRHPLVCFVRSHPTSAAFTVRASSYADELVKTAKTVASPGRGILAMDESNATCGKRLASIGLENTEANRQAYRTLLVSAPGLGNYISGAILFEETLYQSTIDGKKMVDVLVEQNIVPGIKVDKGLVPLPGSNNESWCQGLDGLSSRTAAYYQQGARFAKWRTVVSIPNGPSALAVKEAAWGLARYAAISQDSGLVPIVEPEILLDGDHGIDRTFEVAQKVWAEVFFYLAENNVMFEGILLKPSMVTPGAECKDKATPQQVADYTLKLLHRRIPPAVPGIMFLSGGQSEVEATLNLNAMNQSPNPWHVSFSYARALQNTCLKTWGGRPENVKAAQDALLVRAKANSLAQLGKYTGEGESEEAKKGMFVKGYVY
ncbi:hypothetical protein CXB51_035526 [Gossypium anomalum]|uniref:Fructose-bisphosphate aldolase n=2 Tax=Gossypium TaxID=3633 RepID=A0A8J6CG15_9ROSI|nr:hypothetical protein CXB51_035526 [Gossypium anomalum]